MNHRFFRLVGGGGSSYSSTSLVWMIRYTCFPFLNSSTPVIESSAGIPARSGFKGGIAGAFLLTGVLLVFLLFTRGMEPSINYPTASGLEHHLRYRMYFPYNRHATLQALGSRSRTGSVGYVKK